MILAFLRWLYDPVAWYATYYSAVNGVPSRVTRGVIRAEGWRRGIPPTWEPTVGEHSYGPMQILASTARDVGFRGNPEALSHPDVGIKYGVRYLRTRLDRWPDPCDAISAYNAGRPITGNRAYVCRADPRCRGC